MSTNATSWMSSAAGITPLLPNKVTQKPFVKLDQGNGWFWNFGGWSGAPAALFGQRLEFDMRSLYWAVKKKKTFNSGIRCTSLRVTTHLKSLIPRMISTVNKATMTSISVFCLFSGTRTPAFMMNTPSASFDFVTSLRDTQYNDNWRRLLHWYLITARISPA